MHNWHDGVEHCLADFFVTADGLDVVYGGLESRLSVEEVLVCRQRGCVGSNGIHVSESSDLTRGI